MSDVQAVATIDLGPAKYNLQTFRMFLEAPGPEFFDVGLRTPKGECIPLQIRHQDAYVVGFRGASEWYTFEGERAARGRSCGVGANYHDLGYVGKVTYDDLNAIGEINRFGRGTRLNKRLVAISIAVTSEAARFYAVATYFTGLTNSVEGAYAQYMPKTVDFEHLRATYFKHWANPPKRADIQPGQVYHLTESSIALPHGRKP